MVADLCRLYHYSVDHVLSMPVRRASFLWSRGRTAETMQAHRIAVAMNGKDLDSLLAEKKDRKRQFKKGVPSPEGEAIMRAMMEETQ